MTLRRVCCAERHHTESVEALLGAHLLLDGSERRRRRHQICVRHRYLSSARIPQLDLLCTLSVLALSNRFDVVLVEMILCFMKRYDDVSKACFSCVAFLL